MVEGRGSRSAECGLGGGDALGVRLDVVSLSCDVPGGSVVRGHSAQGLGTSTLWEEICTIVIAYIA